MQEFNPFLKERITKTDSKIFTHDKNFLKGNAKKVQGKQKAL